MGANKRGWLASTIVGILSLVVIFGLYPVAVEAAGETGITLGWKWKVLEDGTLGITGHTAPPSYAPMTVPGSLDTGSGPVAVTRIESNAFKSSNPIFFPYTFTKVSIPDSVTSIGDGAFARCSNLTALRFSAGLQSIGASAFEDCSALANTWVPGPPEAELPGISLPEALKTIGSAAFAGCGALATTNIADLVSLETIGGNAFRDCRITEMMLCDSVTSIGEGAFNACRKLVSVRLPENQQFVAIPANLFSQCQSLLSLTIPQSVTSIGADALNGCDVLFEIVVAGANSAFSGADGVLYSADGAQLIWYPAGRVGTLNIPAGVREICDTAFYNASHLTAVSIPEGVTTIGAHAFLNCTGLTQLVLPSTVSSIGASAFSGCGKLLQISIPDAVKSIAAYTFSSCNRLTQVHLPDGLLTIANGAFLGCSSLTQVTVPPNITAVGDNAFGFCTGLKKVIILSSGVMSFGKEVFTYTGVVHDGIYGFVGSAAQTYAADSGIAFHAIPILASIQVPSAITGVANGTAKTASALGLPSQVTLDTDGDDVQADVTWAVSASSYDPGNTAEQSFTVDGIVTLPSGVGNLNGVSLDVSIDVSVNAAASTDKTLISITAPTEITGVANGTAKTASALGLPATVILVTDSGNFNASVSWDVAACAYSPSAGNSQTFVVNGTVTLPNDVVNPASVSLNISIQVTVIANSGGPSGGDDSGDDSPGGGSSGGSGGNSTPGTPAQTGGAEVSVDGKTVTTLQVEIDQDTDQVVANIGAELGDQIAGGSSAVVSLPPLADVNRYALSVPTPCLMAPDQRSTLTINTGVASLALPSNMLTGALGDSADQVTIAIGAGDKSALPEAVKEAIGDRPLIQLSVLVDGRQTDWNNPSAPVMVSIPYTPNADELAHPESIVVWYIDGSGTAVPIPNGHYDPATGTVAFAVTHFSDYAVAYNQVRFNDVLPDAWYRQAVSFIAARGITGGTGNGNYSPAAKLTRGEFIVLMMRAYGIAPESNPTDNFSDAGSTYYTGYLAAAKRLGISAGVGDNLYAPGKVLTHQEMFALLHNALRVIGQLPQGETGQALADFSDAGQIAPWAKGAMTLFVETGTVLTDAGKLAPAGVTTRAEMAQALFNLLGR